MIKKNAEFDVVIAGGGPAGLSALLWCSELRLEAILLEKEPELGGQLLRTYNVIQNYLGVKSGNGIELRDIFLRQVANTGLKRLTGAEIVEADLARKTMTLTDGTAYSARAIVIATGVRRRKLGVPGEEEFCGRGILESGVKTKNEVRGKTVLIVGGGDAALENALILSETAHKIIVVHRRSQFTARPDFVEMARALEKIEFCFNTEIKAIVGKETVDSVELKHLSSGAPAQLPTDAVLVRIGVEPNTEMFRGQIGLDDAGYAIIGDNCATSMRGVFAVGDVANHDAPTIAAAVGHSATAVKAIHREMNFH